MSRPKHKAQKLSPKQRDARDEGPRLLPLSPEIETGRGTAHLHTDGYVALADRAMEMWSGKAVSPKQKVRRAATHV